MPGTTITAFYVEPTTHIRSYAVLGALQGVLWPIFWVTLNLNNSRYLFVWWSHFVALLVMLVLSWGVTAHGCGIMFVGDYQKKADAAFFRWYCRTFVPTCFGIVIYLLCYSMMF